MASDELEDISMLWSENSTKPGKERLSERRRREVRTPSPTDRRAMISRETKTVQFNIRITPTLKAKISSLALSGKISMAELLERAIAAYGDGE
jgi:hypothetical protein